MANPLDKIMFAGRGLTNFIMSDQKKRIDLLAEHTPEEITKQPEFQKLIAVLRKRNGTWKTRALEKIAKSFILGVRAQKLKDKQR